MNDTTVIHLGVEAMVITGSRRGREVEYRLTDEHVLHIALDAIAHANERA